MKTKKPRPTTGSPGVVIAIIAIGGFMAAWFFWTADIFWQDEGFTFFACLAATIFGLWRSSASGLHILYVRGNAAIGMARLAVVLSIAWCAYVLFVHADPTIFDYFPSTMTYVLMGLCAIKIFGQAAAELFGPKLRLDVYERKNLAAGTFIGGFTLGAGMIFGGALWGEMTPESLEYSAFFEQYLPTEKHAASDAEKGWWITPWFFLMGWLIYVASLMIWLWSEKGNFAARIVRERRFNDARAAAYYCIAIAITITYGVSGDYYGFWESMFGFSFVALPVLAHGVMRPGADSERARDLEGLTYIALAVVGVLLMPWFADLLGLRL